MNNFDVAQEWFDIAEMDISSAKYLQTMIPMPIEIICYHCQQSVEKYLKGYLALNEHEIIKTHDLTILNKLYPTINKHLMDDLLEFSSSEFLQEYDFHSLLDNTKSENLKIIISKIISIFKHVPRPARAAPGRAPARCAAARSAPSCPSRTAPRYAWPGQRPAPARCRGRASHPARR